MMANDLIRRTTNATAVVRRQLTPEQYVGLAEVPPESEFIENIKNPKTRRAYEIDIADFIAFAGFGSSAELRTVTRAHVIAWRKDLETRHTQKPLADTTIRRKLAALSARSIISASAMRYQEILSMASNGPRRTPMKAALLPSANARPAACWTRRTPNP